MKTIRCIHYRGQIIEPGKEYHITLDGVLQEGSCVFIKKDNAVIFMHSSIALAVNFGIRGFHNTTAVTYGYRYGFSYSYDIDIDPPNILYQDTSLRIRLIRLQSINHQSFQTSLILTQDVYSKTIP